MHIQALWHADVCELGYRYVMHCVNFSKIIHG